jgi:hypothetical protein
MKAARILAGILVCLSLATSARAQGTGSSGTITGTVTDPAGAVVPNVQVSATEIDRGVVHNTQTDSSGVYRLEGLAPSTYEITASAQGFEKVIQKGVTVTVGGIQIADFHLVVATAQTTLEVTSELPTVETERGSQANTLTDNYISGLPINRRDYLTYTLLMPGVSNSYNLANNSDFRVKQTPQSGLSFYGSNGRGNSVTLDGGEFNDDSGGVRFTVSQEAVQEFQVNRSNYAADLGGASGASINIVSKSGTNNVHGSLFALFRDSALDARDTYAFSQALAPGVPFDPAGPDFTGSPVKNSLSRQQYGGSIGFPIKKDKTFVYAAFEGLHSDAQNAVPLLLSTTTFRPEADQFNDQQAILTGLATLPGNPPVPCLTAQPALPAQTCAGILTNVLTVSSGNPLGAFLVNELESNGGLFPYNTRTYLASVRLDHQFSDNDHVHLLYAFNHDLEQSPDVQSLIGFSNGSSIHDYANTIQGAWYHQFSPTTQNELLLQWNYTDFNVIPNVPTQAGLNITGFAGLGTNIFLPSFTIMRRYQISDNVTMIRGRHTIKFGFFELFRGNHTESHTFFPGRFVFGTLPGGLLSPCLEVPAACGLAVAPATINGLQGANLGLPQFYQQGFGNPIYNYPRPFTALYFQDAWQIRPNFTLNYGLRYELDSQYGPLRTPPHNFAPRVSFAWDPFKDHKTVVRGGYGIFYSPIYGQIADVVKTLGNINDTRQIAILLVPLTGAPGNPALNSAAIYQTLFAQGKITCTAATPTCITAGDLTQFGINVTNSGPLPPAPGAAPLPVIFSGQSNYSSPYSQQASLGVEREVAPGWTVSASYIYVHTLRLPVAIDTNALATAPNTPYVLANGQMGTFKDWSSPACTANPFMCFANPFLLQTDQYSSKSSAVYNAGILELRKTFSHDVSLFANYTWSHAIDTSTDFNSDYGPQDNTNLNAERANSDFDQRNKFVFAGVFQSPLKSAFLRGWQLSPIVSYNSSHPFNLLVGSDVNGDRHFTNDRPIGAPRNSGIGPTYTSFDMRLSRTFMVHERYGIEFIAESFNIANHTNDLAVNDLVPPLFGFSPTFTTFKVHGSVGNPSLPLSFTSALPKRQIQLGARFTF